MILTFTVKCVYYRIINYDSGMKICVRMKLIKGKGNKILQLIRLIELGYKKKTL